MPFDPKVVRGDEAAFDRGEIELPDDLVHLAEQLDDDAQHLSACYPPPLGPAAEAAANSSQPSPRFAGRSAIVLASAVGGLVALACLVIFTLNLGDGNQTDRKIAAEPGMNDLISEVVTDDSEASSALAGNFDAATSSQPAAAPSASGLATPAVFSGSMPALTPAVLKTGITGPEMEAWMDLRQDELAMDVERIEF